MASIAGIKVGSASSGKSKGGRNSKDVVQGTTQEGSSFWRNLRKFLGCMRMNSKGGDSSIDKKNKGIIDTKDIVRRHQPNPESSSSKKSRWFSRSCTPKLSKELLVASSLLRRFTFEDLKLATRNFRADNFLGEGGFGTVLKGWISQNGNHAARPGMGTPVAVKCLNLHGFQGHKEWLAEISYLSELHHPHLVKLVGFCIEGNKRLLVYEFMCRGSLEKHLFRRNMHLPWHLRIKIVTGAAKGLLFLHEEASRPVIFRDFKTSNILLDMNYNAKLSDFGLAKDAPVGDASHVSTQVMGTQGYAAPEYVMTGHLTSKSDVYSFGVVLLEILTGRKAMETKMPKDQQNLVEWLRPLLRNKANFTYLMDPRLHGEYSMRGAQIAMRLATHCVRSDPKARPLMSEVVRVLKSVPLFDEVDAHPSPSSSIPSISTPSNSIRGSNKYGLRTSPAPNVQSRFQASPLGQDYPLPPPNPSIASSSNPSVGQP